MTELLALACVLLALPGLLLERFGPLTVRLLTLVAVLVLLVAALNLEQVVQQRVPARIAVVGTGDEAPPDRLARRIAASGADVQVVEESPWPARLAIAALRAGPRARELALLWTGPLSPGAPVLTGRGLSALIPNTSLDLEPDQLQAWAVGGFQTGRPGALQVRLGMTTRTLQVQVLVTDPAGEELVRQTVELGPGTPVVEVPVIPRSAGLHSLSLGSEVDGVVLHRRGSFEVAAPESVMVVGRGAELLSRALEVQGMAAVASPDLPGDLADWAVLVLTGPASAADQQRLATYLDGGGGLFLVGGEDGALPQPDEPLYELLPVLRRERDPVEGDGTEEEGAEEEVGEPPDETPPDEEARQEEPPPPDEPPAGEVGETELDLTEEEVDRRVVSMVLVVDRSQSMGNRVLGGQLVRMDYAKRSALATAEALQEGDELGLVTFGNKNFGRTELPLTPVTEWEKIRQGVSRLRFARESTYISSGLERAGALLGGSAAPVRFVVVVTDGVFQDDLLAPRTARRLAARGITVSLIQIVSPGETTGAARSKRLTDAGQGRYMQTGNPREVPRLVVAEVGVALGRVGREPRDPLAPETGVPDPEVTPPDPAETEPPGETDPPDPEPAEVEVQTRLTVRAVVDSVLLEPRRPGGFPDLAGMEAVLGRPDAHVLLVGGEEGLPLLAFANRGLGRVGVWSSDLTGPWGEAWRDDADFPGRLATWVQSLFPPREEMPGDLLTVTEMQPVVPTPSELKKLAELATGPVLAVEDYRAPGARIELSVLGLAQTLALPAALALVLLALGECLALRRRGQIR